VVSCIIMIEGFSSDLKVFKNLFLLGMLRPLTFQEMYFIGKFGGGMLNFFSMLFILHEFRRTSPNYCKSFLLEVLPIFFSSLGALIISWHEFCFIPRESFPVLLPFWVVVPFYLFLDLIKTLCNNIICWSGIDCSSFRSYDVTIPFISSYSKSMSSRSSCFTFGDSEGIIH
jgi:hypothetical protein